MTELLEFARFHYFSEWLALGCVIAAILLLNRVLKLNMFNALAPAQAILVFNVIPVISGYTDSYIDTSRTVHFFLTEGIFMAAICAVYAHIIRQVGRNHESINDFFKGPVPYIFIALSILVAVFAYLFTPQDGTSRILYQTNYWYSLVKPGIEIFVPVSYFAVFVLLLGSNRRLPAYVLLLANVLGSVASGSKGAFVIQTVSALLMVRDLGLMSKFHLNRIDLALAGTGLASGVTLSLQRLELTAADLWDRIMLFGEPTLLTYFAPDPTAACRNLSLLAKMHRGWARALGDPSALNIDTLFGYAWMIQYVGVNTFTGPNARFSAYLICNFPGAEIVFGVAMTAFYLALAVFAVRLAVRQNRMIPVIYAFVVFSISEAGQDFNLLMQDVNFLIGLIVVLAIAPRIGPRAKPQPSSSGLA